MIPKIFVFMLMILLSACEWGSKPVSKEGVSKEPVFAIPTPVTLGHIPEGVSLKGISKGRTADEMISTLPLREQKSAIKLLVFSVKNLNLDKEMVSAEEIYKAAKGQGYGPCPQDLVLYMLIGNFDKPNTTLYLGMNRMKIPPDSLDPGGYIFAFTNASGSLALHGSKDLWYGKSDYFLLCQ